jgi:hypothetical protein
MLDKIKEFHTALIKSTTKESSKRYVAIFTMFLMALGHVVIFVKGTSVDLLILIGSDMGFIATLLGISTYENNLKERLKHDKEGIDN